MNPETQAVVEKRKRYQLDTRFHRKRVYKYVGPVTDRANAKKDKRGRRHSKSIGKAFEYRVACFFKRWFPFAAKTKQESRHDFRADIINVPLYVECKTGDRYLSLNRGAGHSTEKYSPDKDKDCDTLLQYYEERRDRWANSVGEPHPVVLIYEVKFHPDPKRRGVWVMMRESVYHQLVTKEEQSAGADTVVHISWKKFSEILDLSHPIVNAEAKHPRYRRNS